MFFNVVDNEGTVLASGWYADSEFSGTLADDRLSGIRVRLGNILIGTAKTLSPYFKESRFNGWVLGELYIISKNLIPNARRDDFERNETFSQFENGIRATVGSEVSDKIRAASKARNNPAAKTLKKEGKAISQTETILTTGFNSSFEKEQVVESLEAIKKELRTIPKSAAPEVIQQKVQLIQTIEVLWKIDSDGRPFHVSSETVMHCTGHWNKHLNNKNREQSTKTGCSLFYASMRFKLLRAGLRLERGPALMGKANTKIPPCTAVADAPETSVANPWEMG